MKRDWADAAFELRKNRVVRALGVPAYQMGRRLRATHGPTVLVNSFPKSGTHLVMEAMSRGFGLPFSGIHLDDSTGRARQAVALERTPTGTFSTAHLAFDPHLARFLCESRFVLVYVDRDPIAALLSLLAYVPTRPHDGWTLLLGEGVHDPNVLASAVLDGSIDASVFQRPFADEYERYLSWWNAEGVMPIAYEGLIGADGSQLLEHIAHHVALTVDTGPVEMMSRLIETRTATSSTSKIELSDLEPAVASRMERELLPLRERRQQLRAAANQRRGGTS